MVNVMVVMVAKFKFVMLNFVDNVGIWWEIKLFFVLFIRGQVKIWWEIWLAFPRLFVCLFFFCLFFLAVNVTMALINLALVQDFEIMSDTVWTEPRSILWNHIWHCLNQA